MGKKTKHDATWIEELPLYVLEDILQKELAKLSIEEVTALIEEAEKKYGKSLVDIGLELSCSEELSQQEREEIYETLKRYMRAKNVDFKFD
jgi:hypothetical protein